MAAIILTSIFCYSNPHHSNQSMDIQVINLILFTECRNYNWSHQADSNVII
jgi:hypothetical protein